MSESKETPPEEGKPFPARPEERWSDYVRRLDGLPPLTDDQKAEQGERVINELLDSTMRRAEKSPNLPKSLPPTQKPAK